MKHVWEIFAIRVPSYQLHDKSNNAKICSSGLIERKQVWNPNIWILITNEGSGAGRWWVKWKKSRNSFSKKLDCLIFPAFLANNQIWWENSTIATNRFLHNKIFLKKIKLLGIETSPLQYQIELNQAKLILILNFQYTKKEKNSTHLEFNKKTFSQNSLW